MTDSKNTRMRSSQSPPLRVLVVTHYFPEHGGGIEIVARQLATRLLARGFAVEWMASRNPRHEPTDAPGALPEPAWNITERRFGIPYPIWSPFSFSRLRKAIRRCDILHLHDTLYMGNVMASAAARQAGKPVLVTQHVGIVPYRSRVLAATMEAANRLLAANVLRRAAATVFYSKTTERYFLRLLPNAFPSAWIANGIDGTCFHPLPQVDRLAIRRELGWRDDRPIMLFVGRFVEKKGLPIIRSLAGRFPDHLWVMAGTGPQDPTSWNLPNVRTVGQLAHRETARLYQAADLLVLPSVGEGLPLVVQESLACGTPAAVATDTATAHPGLADVVWSASPDAESFGALLKPLVSTPGLLQQRRERVAAFAHREWNWEICADRYAELIRTLVGNPSMPGSPLIGSNERDRAAAFEEVATSSERV